jgi:hypothetical protein
MKTNKDVFSRKRRRRRRNNNNNNLQPLISQASPKPLAYHSSSFMSHSLSLSLSLSLFFFRILSLLATSLEDFFPTAFIAPSLRYFFQTFSKIVANIFF